MRFRRTRPLHESLEEVATHAAWKPASGQERAVHYFLTVWSSERDLNKLDLAIREELALRHGADKVSLRRLGTRNDH